MLLRALGTAVGLTLALNTAQAAEPRLELDLEVQELESTLKNLAAQANVKLRYAGELLRGKTAPVLRGRHSLRQALDRLLDGTELSYEISPQGVVTIKQRAVAAYTPRQNGDSFQLPALTGSYTIVSASAMDNVARNIEGTPGDPTRLPEVLVTERLDQDSPYNTRYIRPNTLTATRTNTPIMETPFSVQVVPQQVLRDQQAIRLDNAAQNVSGVIQVPTNGGLSDGFLVRGFASQSIYRNGVFMPDALGGGTTRREMANIEQVEILKGPGSILFGRADPGGIINTVTKQPLATPYYSLQQQAGTFDFYRTTIDATGPVTKDNTLLYRMNLSYENTGSFRNFIDRESVFFAPVMRWNINPQTQVTVELEYQNFDEKPDPGIPSLGHRPAPVPRSLALHEPLKEHLKYSS